MSIQPDLQFGHIQKVNSLPVLLYGLDIHQVHWTHCLRTEFLYFLFIQWFFVL